jgi:hypothetical protein
MVSPCWVLNPTGLDLQMKVATHVSQNPAALWSAGETSGVPLLVGPVPPNLNGAIREVHRFSLVNPTKPVLASFFSSDRLGGDSSGAAPEP